MKRLMMAAMAVAVTVSANAEPGFVYAKFTGLAYDGSSDIWSAPSRATGLSASMLYYSSSSSYQYQQTTFAYGAYMYMQGDTTYSFRALYDDYASVKVDGMMVIAQTAGCQEGTGAIRFKESGWHKIELRASNDGGPCGAVGGYSYVGIYYSTNSGATWQQFADSGDGNLFRTDLPSGAVIPKEIDLGLPGFRMATFHGTDYDGGSSIWNNATVRMVYPAKLYIPAVEGSGLVPEHTTYAYGAYMHMQGGVTYKFKAAYDDFSTVKVGNMQVIGKPYSECQEQTGEIAIAETGWYKIELRVSNNGGYGGAINNVGIVYSTSKDPCWMPMSDGGSGNLFRIGLEPGTLIDARETTVGVISSSVRETDPTILDVVYKVYSNKKSTVKVRVLAFEDGERSFATVVRPETFVDGTGVNVGDAIAANVEHKISWRVSGDWKTKLAKVKFEVLASEGELLPLETMTIPASDQYGKMKITWNAISDSQVFDALLWLYADKDPGLTLSAGVLRGNGVNLAKETELGHKKYDWSDEYWDFDYRVNAARYVLLKMGYSLLTGAPLTYANQETRLGLSPSGARQYGYKIVE